MQIDSIHIVLLSVIALFFLLSLFLFSKLKGKNKWADKRINKIALNFKKEKLYLDKEIKRQNYLISEYKQKGSFVSENNSHASLNINQQNPEFIKLQKNIAENAVSESEKQKFSDKNKKLWELSLAIHKEKEKIDEIKNEIEHRHNEVTKSINYAQRIQKALLPSEDVFKQCPYEYFVLWKPRDIVSGDFYWLKQFEELTIVVVADCTGHGVPGAFMSVLGISFLNDILSKGNTFKANEVLEKMRMLVKSSFHQQDSGRKVKASDGMDMAICIINNKTLELDFAGANNPLYIIRNNELTTLKATRSPIGSHPFEKPFESQDFTLQKDDQLYMFSDGFIDQFGGQRGRKFLKKNFQRLLLHITKEQLPMEEEKEILSIAMKEWQGNKYKQIDDILILGLRI